MIYRCVDDLLAVETLVLDEHRLVTRALCHYRSDPEAAVSGNEAASGETPGVA